MLVRMIQVRLLVSTILGSAWGTMVFEPLQTTERALATWNKHVFSDTSNSWSERFGFNERGILCETDQMLITPRLYPASRYMKLRLHFRAVQGEPAARCGGGGCTYSASVHEQPSGRLLARSQGASGGPFAYQLYVSPLVEVGPDSDPLKGVSVSVRASGGGCIEVNAVEIYQQMCPHQWTNQLYSPPVALSVTPVSGPVYRWSPAGVRGPGESGLTPVRSHLCHPNGTWTLPSSPAPCTCSSVAPNTTDYFICTGSYNGQLLCTVLPYVAATALIISLLICVADVMLARYLAHRVYMQVFPLGKQTSRPTLAPALTSGPTSAITGPKSTTPGQKSTVIGPIFVIPAQAPLSTTTK